MRVLPSPRLWIKDGSQTKCCAVSRNGGDLGSKLGAGPVAFGLHTPIRHGPPLPGPSVPCLRRPSFGPLPRRTVLSPKLACVRFPFPWSLVGSEPVAWRGHDVVPRWCGVRGATRARRIRSPPPLPAAAARAFPDVGLGRTGARARAFALSTTSPDLYRSQPFGCPERTEGNYRLYGERALKELEFIKHCRSLDIPLTDVKRLMELKNKPEESCASVNKLIAQQLALVNNRMRELKALKAELQQMASLCTTENTIEACGIIKSLDS